MCTWKTVFSWPHNFTGAFKWWFGGSQLISPANSTQAQIHSVESNCDCCNQQTHTHAIFTYRQWFNDTKLHPTWFKRKHNIYIQVKGVCGLIIFVWWSEFFPNILSMYCRKSTDSAQDTINWTFLPEKRLDVGAVGKVIVHCLFHEIH